MTCALNYPIPPSPDVPRFCSRLLQHLFDAREDRFEFLQEQKANLLDDANFLRDQTKELLDEEEGDEEKGSSRKEQQLQREAELAAMMSKLESVHIQGWLSIDCPPPTTW